MIKKILQEIESYKNEDVEISEGVNSSAYKVIRRISFFKNELFPTGKFDSQENYKFYFNVITPRVNSEVKNIDLDTKDISLYSDITKDTIKIMLSNARMREWLHESGQAEKLNDAVEKGSADGSVVWKKTKDGYEVKELNTIMVLNQTAYSIQESDVIEQECLTASDLRKKNGVWDSDKVEELIKMGSKKKRQDFYVYERNGEVSEKEYNEAKGKKGGKEDKYYQAKVIVGGTEKDKPTTVLFCEYLTDKGKKAIYKEYHRSAYTGTWLRRGLYQLLMDYQIRANEIGNQIARGLEWASKAVFTGADKLMMQNILTDLQNGDYVKAKDLRQVEVRMQGLDQLIADWNRCMVEMDKLANSYEVVQGVTPASGTPLGTSQMLNQNAGKLFDFIREKLGIALEDIIEEWILPDLLKDLKKKDVLRLTEDSGYLQGYYQAVIESWYIDNLLALPPHDEAIAQELKQQKLQEISKKKEAMVNLEEDMWKEYAPKVRVKITGENVNRIGERDELIGFIGLEIDPIRRSALLEMAIKKSTNIDVSQLPKSPPQPQPAMAGQQQGRGGLDQILEQQESQL